MEIKIALLLLLSTSVVWAMEPTLIISTSASYSGVVSTTYQYMYFVVNNSSRPMEYLGHVVPPFGASVIYIPANGSYPPPIAIFYNITYINASLTNNELYCSNNSLIKINFIIKNYMPFSIPVTVLVQRPPGVEIMSDVAPSGVENLGGTTVYQWTFFVSYEKKFSISYRVVNFGDFGAANLPSVEIISDIDLSGYIEQANSSIIVLNNTYNYLNNLTYAVNIFNNLIYNTTNNLNNLVSVLNLSSAAFEEGAKGLNASQYVVKALNSQLAAISASLLGVASTLNRSLLLIQYEYAYLTTLSNALETQAIAIGAYENSLSTSVQALNSIEGNLYTIYFSLQSAENSINRIYLNLISIKQKVNQINSNNTLVENATKALNQELDYAIDLIQSLQSTVDSAKTSVGALIGIVSTTRNALVAIGGQLGQVEGLLNQTALATRRNATAMLREMPPIIINASRSLVDIANNLTVVAGQVNRLVAPINDGVAYLISASRSLKYSAGQIKSLSTALEGELPYLGLVNSIISNYRYNITKTIERYEYFSSVAKTYKKIYGAGVIRYEFVLTLPIAVNPASFTFNLTTPSVATNSGRELPTSLAALAGILVAISMVYLRLRR
ncbi:MAG: hypothetical protein ACP5KY_00060 [Thermoproteus sp.]